MAHGGHGCISVTSNVAPRLCADMQNACLAGDFAAALKIQDQLTPLHQASFADPNPAGAKFALSVLGKIGNELRLPMLPAGEAAQKAIKAAMVVRPLARLNAYFKSGWRDAAAQRGRVLAHKEDINSKVAAENRRARFDFEIGETFEAGLMLDRHRGEIAAHRQGDDRRELCEVDRAGEVYLVNAQYPGISAGKPLQPRAETSAQAVVEGERNRPHRQRESSAKA